MKLSSSRSLTPLLLAASIACASARLHADPPPTLSGTWTASAMTERWNIGDWGDKCGPRPQPQGAPGGSATITQSGSELSISGAGRSYSTANCWEQAPGLRRVSHSASARGWSNRCTTAANDPRQATVVTTMSATDTAISFDETGSYQFVLEGQNCTASVRRSRSFKLVQRDGEAPAPTTPVATTAPPATTPPPTATSKPTPAPTVEPPKSCDSPGDPARIEVRPARKLMRPGEEFAFRAWITDARGCRLDLRPTWIVTPSDSKIQVDAIGNVKVAADVTEGQREIIVTVGDQKVRVSVEIASVEHYESLLASSGLNARGEAEESAVAVFTTSSLGGGSAVAEDKARKRKTIFVAIVGTSALALAAIGLVLLRRGAKKQKKLEEEADLEEQDRAQAKRQRHEVIASTRPNRGLPEVMCPVCRAEFPPGSLFCPDDGTRLVQVTESRPPAGGVCPSCGRGFDASIKVCPDHGEILVPAPLYNATIAKRPVVVEKKGKICPTCGARYGGEAIFCGKDGTTLVLVN